MRWPFAFILAYVMLGLQVGVSRYIAFHGAAPNLALIAVLFIALNMRRNGALLVSFSVGFVQDLLSGQQLGLYAFAYGLVAMTIVAAHRIWNRNHPATYIVVALVGGFITTMVLLLHSLLHPAAPALGEGKDAAAGDADIRRGRIDAAALYRAAGAVHFVCVAAHARAFYTGTWKDG